MYARFVSRKKEEVGGGGPTFFVAYRRRPSIGDTVNSNSLPPSKPRLQLPRLTLQALPLVVAALCGDWSTFSERRDGSKRDYKFSTLQKVMVESIGRRHFFLTLLLFSLPPCSLSRASVSAPRRAPP